MTGVAELQLWHATLDLMARVLGAAQAELDAIRAWITRGATVDLLSQTAHALLPRQHVYSPPAR